jgi:SAM-dependent methyltransferase
LLGGTVTDLAQHNTEIHENKRHWDRKPLLRDVYAGFYREIAAELQGLPPGLLVECGAGIGNLKRVLPHCLATDLFPNPWLDRTENVYALSFGDGTVAGLVLFDVFHHLEHPGAALREMHRVLVPGGRLVVFDPAMGLLGRVVLGLFHHEPLGLRRAIAWDAPAGFNPHDHRYYAAQGNASRIFARPAYRGLLAAMGWQQRTLRHFPALPWLLTGGFRGPQLCPNGALPAVRWAERVLALAPRFFASRLLVVLEKAAAPPEPAA